jgi:hypothetical protein
MNPTLALQHYFLSLFSSSFPCLRGEATIPKKEMPGAGGGCFSCRAASNEWKGGGTLGLEDVTNFL